MNGDELQIYQYPAIFCLKMEWFRRKDKNYSNLKNDSEIEMTRHDAEATQRSCSQETSEMCSENITQYGSFSEETKAQVTEKKITTWQASWNIINMIQVIRFFSSRIYYAFSFMFR